MRLRTLLFAVLVLAAFAHAQTIDSPDCDIPFSLSSTGPSQTSGCAANNQGVRFWAVIYKANGFTGLSLTMQEAPDNAGVPGTWSTFTATTGINPMTSLTGLGADTTYTGYAPWVRVNLSGTSGTGTVAGHIYGCRQPGCGSGGSGTTCSGTTGSPCQNQILPDGTPNVITLSSSGLTRIITHSGSNVTNVGLIAISFVSAVTVQFEYGTQTSTACDTGTTAWSGTFQNVVTIALDNPGVVPAGQDLCVNLGASVTGGGLVAFKQP